MPLSLALVPLLVILLSASPVSAIADYLQAVDGATSKRIEVYGLSQNYWDTQYGDTLDNIVLHLLPNNPAKHAALKQSIVQLNPQAFINGDASRLLAGKRLALPGYLKQADSKVDPADTRVESYSWGNIKRPKR